LKATKFNAKFDEGEESILENMVLTQALRPGLEHGGVLLDFLAGMDRL
jgi:hypothetical protein